MNLKGIVAGLAAVAVLATSMVTQSVVSAQTVDVDAEFDGALAEAYAKGMTKYSTAEGFRPFDTLTREQLSKMMSVFAAKEMCILPDTSLTCEFGDVPADPTLADSVKTACQQGLLKGSNGMFYPTAAATKAQVGMVIARAIAAIDDTVDTPSEDGAYWYEDAYNILWDAGITNDSDPSDWDRPILRYEALYFMTRAEGVECSDDITDLLEDIFGDDDDMGDTVDDDSDDDSEPVFETSNGEVMATLSPLTPAGDTVPGLASVWVASFDFSATGEDVMLENVVLERFGLGGDESIDDVTLLVNNEVVSKSRNFNSDAELNTSLNPAVAVEAGETVRLDVVVKVGDAVGGGTPASNQEFQIGLIDFETNGGEDRSNLPLRANEFEVAGINAAEAIVSVDGTVSDVELGEQEAEVAKFEIENDGNDAIYITHITLEDDERNADTNLANFKLTHNNEVVASKAMTNGKYLSFVLDTPVMIDENETEDFKVLADVVDGAGDTILFIIDEEIYVRGYDERFGYGIAVDVTDYTGRTNDNSHPQWFSINAGELTLVELDIERDELRGDRENFVIAAFDINVNAGQDLILEDVAFVVTGTGFPATAGQQLIDHFDEVQLVVMTDDSRRTYDLQTTETSDNSFTAEDDDLGIMLPDSGSVTVLVEVDSITEFPGATIGNDFEVRLNTNTGLRIEETADDEQVTDIVPSNIVFDQITLVESTVDVNGINVKSVSVVKGSENVDAVMFEVETDDVSGVYVESFTFSKTTGTATFGQNSVNAVRVWKKTGATWELIEEEGGFDISGETVTLDNFDSVFVPVASSQVFLMTVDISDDDANEGLTMELELEDIDIEDDDNTQLTPVDPLPISSNRLISITGSGDLDVEADNQDNEIDNTPKFVIAGRTAVQSPFVAAFDFTASNEAIEIEDMILTVDGIGSGNFEEAVTEVEIYDEDKTTLLFSEVVSSTEVDFNNINLIVEEGATTLYVKVVTELIGDNENGAVAEELTFTINISEVKGVDSGDDVSWNPGTQGLVSEEFSIVPVGISNVEFVTSAEGITIDTTSSALSPDRDIAIIKIDADTWGNSDRTDGGTLDLLMNEIIVENSTPSVLSNLTIERLDVNTPTPVVGVGAGTVTFDLAGLDTNERRIESGLEGYFLIKGDIDLGTGSSADVSIELSDLTVPGSSLNYGPSDTIPGLTGATTEDYDVLYIGVNSIESDEIDVDSGS